MKSERVTRKIIVCKYAFTDGPFVLSAEVEDEKYAFVRLPGAMYTQSLNRGDWAYTLEEAQQKIESKRGAKLRSLKKQVQKLEGRQFDWDEVARKLG